MQWYNSAKLQNPFMTCFTFIICNLFKFLSARVHLIWKSTLRYEHEELISQCMHINWPAWHLCYSIPHIRFQPIIVPIFSSSRPFWSASLGFFFHQAFHWSPTVITHQICDRLVQSLGSPAVMSICNSIDQGIFL